MLTLAFDDPSGADTRLVGGKAHGLGTMSRAGIPVSPGFTLTTVAYRQYLQVTGMAEWLNRALADLDRTSIEALEETARSIEERFLATPLPAALVASVDQAYRRLCQAVGVDNVSVAVRSSATAEDSEGASFAGEYETYVGLCGLVEIERHVRRCWASAFTSRALLYAWKNGISPLKVDMAIVVQKTVKARAAGVMFTLSPISGDRSRIVVEASYGIGLSVVGGEVTPDRFVVSKIRLEVLDRILGDKGIEYLEGQVATPVDASRKAHLCLDDEEVIELARLGKLLERQQGAPLDIEFALDRELPHGRNIVLLQCRPETVWSGKPRRLGESGVAALMSNAARQVLKQSGPTPRDGH